MVEQRTENPCVGSSILPSTTKSDLIGSLFCFSKEPTGSHLPFYHEIKAKERILAVSALPYSNTKLSQRKGSVSSSVSGANLFQFMVVFQRVCPAEHGNLYGERPAPHLLWRCNCEESGNFDRPAMKSVRKTALPAHQLQYFSIPCANKAFPRTDYFYLELIYYGHTR